MSVTFHTASSVPRPVRLSEEIRRWAWESLHGRYGDEALANWAVSLDDVSDYDGLSAVGRYDAAVHAIAERAPLRVCPQERVCGAATLGFAMRHWVPALRGGQEVVQSISHLTPDFGQAVRLGVDDLARRIRKRLSAPCTDREREFLNSLENTVESMRIWHARYLQAAERVGREDLCTLLRRVPFGPAGTFHEAVQSLWFLFAFTRICGNWPGIGRIDAILGEYLDRDLAQGRTTLEEAREVLASLFIKGCEWVCSNTPPGSGDAQFYQNIVLAGMDEDGREIANRVTYLVLDIVEELPISDFPISIRIGEKTPKRLLRKAARVIRHGGGVVAVYNEALVLRALEAEGYSPQEARRFANDGCWEVQVPGCTDFRYFPFDSLQILNHALGVDGEGEIPDCGSMEEVYARFAEGLARQVETIHGRIMNDYAVVEGQWHTIADDAPASAVSLFENDCIERARSYRDLGPRYLVRSPHIGGAPDVANSLYAIEQLVFEEKRCTLRELVELLRGDWKENEALRLYAKNRLTYYGNDCDACDRWHTRILHDFAEQVRRCRALTPKDFSLRFVPGVSTFGRQIDWLPQRCAVAFGLCKGTILSGNDSPCPGTDTEGATAILRSHCKADLSEMSCGAALDIRIFPQTLRGEDGIGALVGLLLGFVALGGFFMQIDTVDAETLRAARENPQAYKTLSVRVSGWNARFVTLTKEWQDMIIERTAQGM